jgi:hypothetical protein
MKRISSLIFITSLTASFVALCAAIFSVTGIAKLFAGAAISAAVMASALELGKLVSISFLYQYWEKIPKLLKLYLTSASIILMLITSAGIYGYLTSAYAKVSAVPTQINADIAIATNKIQTLDMEISRKNERLQQIIALRTQQESRLDNLISKSQSGINSSIRNAQTTLSQSDKAISELQKDISNVSTTRDSLAAVSTQKQVEIQTNGDIGTFVYIANMFNVPLDTVVKWFTLIIVFVFDPLAVALVIAINFLIKENNKLDKIDNTVSDDEPYEIFKKPEGEEIEPVQDAVVEKKYIHLPNDGQYYTRPMFDWSNEEMWINNPSAVNYYKNYIEPYKTT